MPISPSDLALWTIVVIALAGVVLRPFRWPEAVWAIAGAALVVVMGFIPLADAERAIGGSLDVCAFLAGMMLLAETARREGLFDWIAAWAVSHAGGSSARLFAMVWLVGVVVTVFLSNDATAVVLTPAVLAVTRAARAPPAPFLLACAFVANAASFVLPISNPANLVVFGSHPPALAAWVERFAVPASLAVIGAFVALRVAERRALAGACERRVARAPLAVGGRWALLGIALAAAVLITVSALGLPIGAPTFALGVLSACVVLIGARAAPWPLLAGVSWSILPLTAALFVLVQALETTGASAALARWLASMGSANAAAASAAVAAALSSNLANNLPVGLLASHALAYAPASALIRDCVLIGVDLGPNLSITGSLATILWLAAIRREGQEIGFWRFIKLGAIVMPASLIPALAMRLLIAG